MDFSGDRNCTNTNSNRALKTCTTPATLLSERCRVCGDGAVNHLHYGVVTCFSCRVFFRRAVEKRSHKDYRWGSIWV